jgi:DNA-binding transcriptional LysR family regulator
MLTEGAAEIGIIADGVDPGGFRLCNLQEDRLVLVTVATHRLADRSEVDFAEVLREPFIGLLDSALEKHLAEHTAWRPPEPPYSPTQLRHDRPHG